MPLIGLLLGLLGAVSPVRAADFLPPERAFKFVTRVVDAQTVEVGFDITPGYYLYRTSLRFTATGATLGAPDIPPGKVKFDETFQKDVETYRDVVRIRLPVQNAPATFTLQVMSQGCADRGLCYPPMPSTALVSLAGFGGDGSVKITAAAADGDGGPSSTASSTEPAPSTVTAGPVDARTGGSGLAGTLRAGRFWPVVATFFLAGVLLSLTPCVLPMLPILSSIIVGQGGGASRTRGFGLAVSYSLGMALVYTAFGIAAGLAGEGLSAALQNAWILGAFAALLVVLALSMFGAYELQLPSTVTNRLSAVSSRLPVGRWSGVFAMGGLSALIVSPCVAAPLAGALVYLSQTRDVALGGSALFSLAAGMSVPLLLLGASAGALLPSAGAWMEGVKHFFGWLLLGVAVYTVQPVLPPGVALAAWGVLALGGAAMLWPRASASTAPLRALRQTLAAVLGLVGVLQWVGAASGGRDALQPIAHLVRGGAGVAAQAEAVQFRTVRTVEEFDAALASAGRPVVLDFYADWCVSCKEMDRDTFTDAAVRRGLAGAVLLRADVTANNEADRALLRRFGLFGPPGTLFFDAKGREIEGARVIGYQDAQRFLQTLATVGL